MALEIPPYNVFVSYTAALRKPMLVPFGMFGPNDSLEFIWTVGSAGTSGSPLPLIGPVDGVNGTFFTPSAVISGAAIFRNGVLQDPSISYTLIGNIVIFNSANIPQIGDDVNAIVFGTRGSSSPQQLVGTIDGVNQQFTTLTPVTDGVSIFRNGLLQDPLLSYSISGSLIIFNSANIPQPGDILVAVMYGSPQSSVFIGGGAPVTLSGTVDGINAVFTVPLQIIRGASIFKNGVLQYPGTEYSLLGQQVTFIGFSIPQVGDVLQAQVF